MTNKNSTQFLGYLHSFRGFAIINIVLIHAVVAALVAIESMNMSNPIAVVNEVLFHDSTLYFAVISGLLYTAILKEKGYKRFYINKLKYVILPYLFLTALVTIFKLGNQEEGSTQPAVLFYFETLFRDLLYGKANALFWYIPVLIFLYLVTPIVDFLINLKGVGKVFLILLMLAPLVVSRIQMAFEYILSIQTMIYFTGAYTVGMYLGTDLDNKLSWVKKQSIPLLILSVLATGVLFYLYLQDIDMYGFISLKETAFYVQKICLSGIFIVMFKNLGEKQPGWLHKVARDSFGIYFLHGFFVFGGIPLFMFLLGYKAISPFNTIVGSVVLLLFSMGVSMLIVLGFRKLMGKNSRMLVGS
ncbi:MAG: acyltransferase [Bacteroidota bacterium]